MDVAGLHLTETVYPPLLKIAPHSHELANFCLVLRGAYDETSGKDERYCEKSALILHPQGEVHWDQHSDVEVKIFCVEFGKDRAELVRSYTPILDTPHHFSSGPVSVIASRIYNEFRRNDSLSPLAIEGLILDVCVAASRGMRNIDGSTSSRWLAQVEGLLHARFRESFSHSESAAEVSVHPVHLARMFRQKYNCTVGDYVRDLRVNEACSLLARSRKSIGEIAGDVGFSDQSHFSRTFRDRMGSTPGDYRRTCFS